jgi:single-strand DNA-binding protein
MNKVILVGNLTRDVELRYSQSGSAIANFGLATSRKWKDKLSGDLREEVLFIDISIFGRSAEIANQYLSKGKKILVEGRLKLEQWTDQNGNNRSKHSVIAESYEFLDPKDSHSGQNSDYSQSGYGGTSSSSGSYSQNSPHSNSTYHPMNDPTSMDIADDEIPF